MPSRAISEPLQGEPSRFGKALAQPWGFALLLGLLLAIFLLAVGLNGISLPFIPGAGDSDAVISHWPNALFFQRSVQNGVFPLWRSLLMSGQPFATNPLNKVWYPSEWALLILPPVVYLNVTLWLHLLLAGVGMRAMARQISLPVEIASLLGIIYAFTPRLIAFSGAGHWDAVGAWAWLPWLLWAVIARRWRWLAVFAALCFLADVRTAALAFVLAGALALWRRPRPGTEAAAVSPFRYWRGAVLAVIGFLGLTAVQWLPLIIALPVLSRVGLTADDAGIFSLTLLSPLQLLLSVRGGSQETMVYVGVGVLVLALVGLFTNWRGSRFWLIVTLLAGLYALGSNGPLWTLLIRLLPALLWLRVPARAWQIGVLALIVLSGYGLQTLLDPIRRLANRRRITRLSAGLFACILLAVVAFPVAPLSAGIAVVMLIGCGLLLIFRSKDRRLIFGLWTALIIVDLLLMDTSLLQGRDQSQWLDRYQPLAEALIADHAAKVYADPAVFPQQMAAYWQIPTFGGVDPFQFSRYVVLNQQINPLTGTDYSVVLPYFREGVAAAQWVLTLDLKTLAQWQVSHIVTDMPVSSTDLRLVAQLTISAQPLYIYANRYYTPGRVITWLDANDVQISADDTPAGVLPDLHGWTRTLNADGSTVYHYAPPEVLAGLLITAVSLLCFAGSWLLAIRWRSGPIFPAESV